MRKRFEIQYELGSTPVENVEIPTNSRDDGRTAFAGRLQYQKRQLRQGLLEPAQLQRTKSSDRNGRSAEEREIDH